MQRRSVWPAAALFIALGVVARAEPAIVQFTVAVHDDTGAAMPARVLVRDAAGRSCVPPVAATENIGPDTWFASAGASRLDVPAGHYHVEVERGPEFEPASADVDLIANASREFRLHRWIDMRSRGFASGENHLHAPPSLVVPLIEAGARWPAIRAAGRPRRSSMRSSARSM